MLDSKPPARTRTYQVMTPFEVVVRHPSLAVHVHAIGASWRDYDRSDLSPSNVYGRNTHSASSEDSGSAKIYDQPHCHNEALHEPQDVHMHAEYITIVIAVPQ